MTLAIHKSNSGFHPRWRTYCQENNIPYKDVDCYANDIIAQLKNCDALMWHHSQGNPKDVIIAKQILFALEHTGFTVFPDFRTGWHFDDKVGQKYLLERAGAPIVPSYVFYDKQTALLWADETEFPKVFKLRGGAGSSNVTLMQTKKNAKRTIRKAFGRGISSYDAWGSLKERIRKFVNGQTSLWDVTKGVLRFGRKPEFARVTGKERGYVYFQDFIPDNDSDTRIIVIGDKAFGLKRYVRENDFRASGSGNFAYEKDLFDERCVQIAFEVNEIIQSQSIAFDFVFDVDNNPLIVEISYGFVGPVYDPCPGYWDRDLNWHEGRFNPQGWMIEDLKKKI